MKVACLGNVLADIVVHPIKRFPKPGLLESVGEIQLFLGGCAANTAAALAKLGVSTFLIAKVGRDVLGDFVEKELKKTGVRLEHMRRDARRPTSATVVLVDAEGERSFLHALAANAELTVKDLLSVEWKRFTHVHLGGYFLFPGLDGEPLARLLRKIRALGVRISLDTAWDLQNRWMKALEPCLPYVDVLFTSRREVEKLTGEPPGEKAAEVFWKKGARAVVMKDGARGALWFSRGMRLRQAAFQVLVRDTTGAGDCFCAGFLAAWGRGLPPDLCLKWGCAAGALAVQELGAVTGLRSLTQLKRLVQKADTL